MSTTIYNVHDNGRDPFEVKIHTDKKCRNFVFLSKVL